MQGEAVDFFFFFPERKATLCTSLQKLVWSGENPGLAGKEEWGWDRKAAVVPSGHLGECLHSSDLWVIWCEMEESDRSTSPCFPFPGALPGPGPNEFWKYNHGSYRQPLRRDPDNWRAQKICQKGARLGEGGGQRKGTIITSKDCGKLLALIVLHTLEQGS